MNEQSDSKVKYEGEGTEIPVHVRPSEKTKNQPQDDWQKIFGEERFWAAAAHAMGPLMIGVAIFADGLTWMAMLFFTAGIYLYYSQKSALVKHHARQALAMQILGTFGWLVLFLSGTAIWVVMLILSLILILVLVGLLLTPLVAIAYPIFVIASFALPLSVALFGAIGAYEVWQGRDYRYPYVANWLDKKLGSVNAQPSEMVIV